MKKTNTKKLDYEKEKTKWYKKLEKSGFVDIELNEKRLKTWSSNQFEFPRLMTSDGGWKIKAEYYYMAAQFLNDYKFDTEIEKTIWTYHSEGLSVREISSILTKIKVKSIPTQRTSIWKVIKRLKKSMYSMYLAPKTEYHE